MDTEIKAVNGKSVKAIVVFTHVLRYFRKLVLEELTDSTGTKINNDDVRWVITVPAIWRQPAKQFMRTAAYQVSSLFCWSKHPIKTANESAAPMVSRLLWFLLLIMD